MIKLLVPLALIATVIIAAVRFGARPAFALPQDVKLISVSCLGNPELTTIQNTGATTQSLNGFALTNGASINAGAAGASIDSYHPLPPTLSIRPGEKLTFYSGTAAPAFNRSLYTLSRSPIYNHALARTGEEGAILTYGNQTVSSLTCNETLPSPTPSPSPTPFSTTPIATAAVFVTPVPGLTPPPIPYTPPVQPLGSATPVATPVLAPSGPPLGTATPVLLPALTPPSGAALASPTPVLTPAIIPPAGTPGASAGGVMVTYQPGWNLVAGTSGTTFSGATALLAIATDGTYSTEAPSTNAVAGQAYWAYFPPSGPAPSVTLQPSNSLGATLMLSPGVWTFIGNPTPDTAQVSDVGELEVYTPSGGYQQATSIPPGYAAAAYSQSGGAVTLSAVSGSGG